jgi:hypothetical protein
VSTDQTTSTSTYGLRKADLGQLHAQLVDEHARKYDFVAPATALRAEAGRLIVAGSDTEISESGVTSYDGRYQLNSIAVEGLAAKLDIPLGYLRRAQAKNLPLFDDNINGWFTHADNAGKRYLVRSLRGDGDGLVRAFLSDRFRIVDNVDVLMATLDGIREAGVPVQIQSCDLTERTMRVRVVCEEIAAYAGDLVENYRSPFGGGAGKDLPMVFAGFELSNSEVGAGQFALTPRITWQVCTNGQTMTRDAVGTRHLGARMDDGIVQWSDATQQTNLKLVAQQTADAVATFLNIDYVTRVLDGIRAEAGAPVNPSTVVETVAKSMKYTEAQQTAILDCFIRSGQVTAGGVMQAVTAAAQLETDGDVAAALEASALEALKVAAAASVR